MSPTATDHSIAASFSIQPMAPYVPLVLGQHYSQLERI